MRRVDKEKAGGGRPPAGADAKADVYVGLVVAKAECLEDNSAAKKKKQPRQNALGEVSEIVMRSCDLSVHSYVWRFTYFAVSSS